eukprot:Nk52_evm39s24 gene=Nk52_evmTU39s24
MKSSSSVIKPKRRAPRSILPPLLICLILFFSKCFKPVVSDPFIGWDAEKLRIQKAITAEQNAINAIVPAFTKEDKIVYAMNKANNEQSYYYYNKDHPINTLRKASLDMFPKGPECMNPVLQWSPDLPDVLPQPPKSWGLTTNRWPQKGYYEDTYARPEEFALKFIFYTDAQTSFYTMFNVLPNQLAAPYEYNHYETDSKEMDHVTRKYANMFKKTTRNLLASFIGFRSDYSTFNYDEIISYPVKYVLGAMPKEDSDYYYLKTLLGEFGLAASFLYKTRKGRFFENTNLAQEYARRKIMLALIPTPDHYEPIMFNLVWIAKLFAITLLSGHNGYVHCKVGMGRSGAQAFTQVAFFNPGWDLFDEHKDLHKDLPKYLRNLLEIQLYMHFELMHKLQSQPMFQKISDLDMENYQLKRNVVGLYFKRTSTKKHVLDFYETYSTDNFYNVIRTPHKDHAKAISYEDATSVQNSLYFDFPELEFLGEEKKAEVTKSKRAIESEVMTNFKNWSEKTVGAPYLTRANLDKGLADLTKTTSESIMQILNTSELLRDVYGSWRSNAIPTKPGPRHRDYVSF